MRRLIANLARHDEMLQDREQRRDLLAIQMHPGANGLPRSGMSFPFIAAEPNCVIRRKAGRLKRTRFAVQVFEVVSSKPAIGPIKSKFHGVFPLCERRQHLVGFGVCVCQPDRHEFLHELHGLWVTLPDGDQLKEAWCFAFFNIGHINADGDRSIGVHHASEVSKVELVHDEQVTTACSGSRTEKSGRGGKNAFRGQGHFRDGENGPANRKNRELRDVGAGPTRNKRSVWEVATSPFGEAHFATFPPALIEPCILAGCPRGGTVLDPFGGAGTTALVADRHGRNAILIELNPEYAAMAERRIRGEAPLFAEVLA